MSDQNEFKCDIGSLRDVLDRIIGFIRNCDQKAGIMLGVNGAVITVLSTQNIIGMIFDAFEVLYSYCRCITFIYIVALLLTIALFVTGFYYLIKSLRANIMNSSSVKSLIFFGDIADVLEEEYQEQINRVSCEEMREDFIAQIYVNACICRAKFLAYKKGFEFSLLGLFSSTMLVLFSVIVNKIL